MPAFKRKRKPQIVVIINLDRPLQLTKKKAKRSKPKKKPKAKKTRRGKEPEEVIVEIGKSVQPKNIALGSLPENAPKPKRPIIGDAVKFQIFVQRDEGIEFAENVYGEVIALHGANYTAKVRDVLWFPQLHGLKNGERIYFERRHIMRLVRQPKWMNGVFYEQRPNEEA